MERRHRTPPHIRHQHRNAVRHLHAKHHPAHFCHHPIAAQHRPPIRGLQPSLQRAVTRFDHPHQPRMNLPQCHQPRRLRRPAPPATSRHQPPPVLRHIRRIILLRPPQIQRPLTIDCRHSTRPRAEPMPQPSILSPTPAARTIPQPSPPPSARNPRTSPHPRLSPSARRPPTSRPASSPPMPQPPRASSSSTAPIASALSLQSITLSF
jgi:hypothetical protein